jgi:hypothetical protein
MYTIQLGSGGEIAVYAYSSSAYQYFRNTSAVFRDYSAWYHFVVAFDSTQATDTNRIKIYVNGVLQSTTSGSGSGWPSLNYDGGVNNTIKHQLSENVGGAQYFDGYLTEINFIDGQALTPSSFGQTDTITGSWVAKKYTGSYGTNGFFLTFADNSAATSTTIGKDYSGNGNNWTPNNISVTAGSTYDSMLDVPSGSGYADGGNGRGNYCVLNPLILVPAGTISNGNLDYSRGSTASHGSAAASFTLPTTGKWYWEVTACSSANNEMIGIANIQNNPQLPAAGSEIGGGSRGDYGYRSDGNKYNNGNQGAYGATYSSGNIIGVAWNSDAGTLVFYKNGTSQGTAFSSITQSAGKFAPAVSSAETSPDSFNFGQRPFSYAVPSGYSALNTTNLSDPTVKNGAGYFAATLYTGNNTSQSISNAVNGTSFQPDFVWIKNRSGAISHSLYDSVRGAGWRLASNETTAQLNYTSQMTAFNSNGFSVATTNNEVNESPTSYVAWNWKANGTGVSNTAGTITSTVSANTTSGFSIVTYTGTGANATVGHGLGVAPSMYIVKRRTGGIGNWAVWHTGLSNTTTSYILLDSTAAQSTSTSLWGSTAATSTTLGIGTSVTTNNSTDTYVAYCFAAIPGYSSFGSYTGNGSTDGPFVFCGFRPRFFMIKRTDTTTNWIMYDTARQPYNTTNPGPIYANLSSAEETNVTLTAFDVLSNGFKPRNTSSWAESNASGGTYIYAAFAENPLKFSNAR